MLPAQIVELNAKHAVTKTRSDWNGRNYAQTIEARVGVAVSQCLYCEITDTIEPSAGLVNRLRELRAEYPSVDFLAYWERGHQAGPYAALNGGK